MRNDPIFCGLVVLFTSLFLLNYRSFLKILPYLGQCAWRWKANIDIEDSLQISRSRNAVAAVLFFPFCMAVYSFDLYRPDFLMEFQPLIRFAIVCGVFVVYLLLRSFLNWQFEMQHFGSKVFTAANRSFFNYMIIIFFVVFITGFLMRSTGSGNETTRKVLLWVLGVTYVFYVLRRGEIFRSDCNPFTTFLYLCGLELLPTAALVLSARLL